jgi:hypothetical protein
MLLTMSAYSLHATGRRLSPSFLTLLIMRCCSKDALRFYFGWLCPNRYSQIVRPKVNTLECQGAIMCSAVRATLLAAFAVCLFPIGTAHAKFSFWPQYGSWWGDHAPFRHNHQHRHTKSESAKENQPLKLPRARSRLSSRSPTNGSRFMTTGRWSHGLQYRLEFDVIRRRSASSV